MEHTCTGTPATLWSGDKAAARFAGWTPDWTIKCDKNGEEGEEGDEGQGERGRAGKDGGHGERGAGDKHGEHNGKGEKGLYQYN